MCTSGAWYCSMRKVHFVGEGEGGLPIRCTMECVMCSELVVPEETGALCRKGGGRGRERGRGGEGWGGGGERRREGESEEGRGREREGGRERGRERGRKGGREGESEEGRGGEREGGREGGAKREGEGERKRQANGRKRERGTKRSQVLSPTILGVSQVTRHMQPHTYIHCIQYYKWRH